MTYNSSYSKYYSNSSYIKYNCNSSYCKCDYNSSYSKYSFKVCLWPQILMLSPNVGVNEVNIIDMTYLPDLDEDPRIVRELKHYQAPVQRMLAKKICLQMKATDPFISSCITGGLITSYRIKDKVLAVNHSPFNPKG